MADKILLSRRTLLASSFALSDHSYQAIPVKKMTAGRIEICYDHYTKHEKVISSLIVDCIYDGAPHTKEYAHALLNTYSEQLKMMVSVARDGEQTPPEDFEHFTKNMKDTGLLYQVMMNHVYDDEDIAI
jgi:hypothetical protein